MFEGGQGRRAGAAARSGYKKANESAAGLGSRSKERVMRAGPSDTHRRARSVAEDGAVVARDRRGERKRHLRGQGDGGCGCGGGEPLRRAGRRATSGACPRAERIGAREIELPEMIELTWTGFCVAASAAGLSVFVLSTHAVGITLPVRSHASVRRTQITVSVQNEAIKAALRTQGGGLTHHECF